MHTFLFFVMSIICCTAMPQRLPMKVDLVSIVIFSNTTLLVTLIAIELTFRVTECCWWFPRIVIWNSPGLGFREFVSCFCQVYRFQYLANQETVFGNMCSSCNFLIPQKKNLILLKLSVELSLSICSVSTYSSHICIIWINMD